MVLELGMFGQIEKSSKITFFTRASIWLSHGVLSTQACCLSTDIIIIIIIGVMSPKVVEGHEQLHGQVGFPKCL